MMGPPILEGSSALLEKAWEILKTHVGAGEPIASSALSEMLGVGDHDKGTVQTRALILELLRRGYPIGAHERGYFLLANEAEKNEYQRELLDRAAAITYRANIVERAWQMYHGSSKENRPMLHWTPDPEEEA